MENKNNDLSIINKDTIIEGKVTANQDLRIDGELHGEIESENKLIIGESGVLDANIKAKEARVYGELEGEIELDETIYVDKNAVINADISARKIVIEAGAKISGKLNIEPDKEEVED